MTTDEFELPTWKSDFERVVNRLAARLDMAFLRFGEAVSRTLRLLAAWIDDTARPHPVR
jgi:hypothetical protein